MIITKDKTTHLLGCIEELLIHLLSARLVVREGVLVSGRFGLLRPNDYRLRFPGGRPRGRLGCRFRARLLNLNCFCEHTLSIISLSAGGEKMNLGEQRPALGGLSPDGHEALDA